VKTWLLQKEGSPLEKVAQAVGTVSILLLLLATPSWAQALSASILPSSRSVPVGTPATAFATIINGGQATAVACRLAPPAGLPVTFTFQTTNPVTNQITGLPNTPVDIPARASQSFVFALTPTAPIPSTDVALTFSCTNTAPAPTIVGVNTLLLTATTTAGPDIVALAATLSGDGVVNVGGTGETGMFSVATINLGATGTLTVSADTGGTSLPVTLAICRTNPATASCLAPAGGPVTLQINANATPTFSIFVTASGPVPLDPANNRIFVRFKDPSGLTRGLTSVAVSAGPFLTAADVRQIVQTAAEAVDFSTMVVAVTDRMGNVLAVFRKPDAPSTVIGTFGVLVDTNELAVGLARTGAFFSNDQAPLSSRTVRFISGIHFPPGVRNTANAALYGIENTNRGCDLNAAFNPGQRINPARSINGLQCNSADRRGCGLGISTGKANLFDSDPNAVNGGGVPIFKEGRLVGGVGVAGVPLDSAEFAASAASMPDPSRFGPRVPAPGVIFLDGIQLPFVNQMTRPGGVGPGSFPGGGSFVVQAIDSPLGAAGVPAGWLVGPLASAELSADDVTVIVNQAVTTANQARAAIRLPLGSKTRMMIAVSDLQGNLIGLFRMADATIFSIDVSVAKARNATFFSGPNRSPADLPGVPIGTSVTARTISFGAQPFYPPGIDSSSPGPFFQLFLNDVAVPCRQGSQPPNANQSGIVFFPGSVALHKNGQLVGGLGVSGDGVDQDDLVTAAGGTGFAPPLEIRADQIILNGARLPFLKFPRNPFE
jgi:uncharacterized protein GlcG (DUF336 family)